MLNFAAEVNDSINASAFNARHQIAALHDPQGHHDIGHYVIAKRVPYAEAPWQQKCHRVKDAASASSLVGIGEADVYVSMGSFWGWSRRIDNLKHIGAVWADLDYHNRRAWEGEQAEFVLEALTVALKDRSIPFPTWVMATGRGLCLVWLHSFIPKAAIPRWTAIQKRLVEALADFGADNKAMDATRVFRVAGSRNPRARGNSSVRALYVSGDPDTLRARAWDFDTLALEMLPVERAQLHSLVAERAKRRADADAAKPPRPTTNLSWATYGETILADLHRLRFLRYGDGQLPAGQRDQWIFVASCALAHACPPEALKQAIVALAADVSGWSKRNATSNMAAVVSRAIAAAGGETVLGPDGHLTDPRYRMRAATIVERLAITTEEMRAGGLRVLVDADRRRELKTRRTRASRQARGASSRIHAQAERLALGRRALALHERGEKVADIATAEGVSVSHVSKAMKEARGKAQ